MEQREISQRALAKEIEVSEGTIRNGLLYDEAATVRNGYAPDVGDAEILEVSSQGNGHGQRPRRAASEVPTTIA